MLKKYDEAFGVMAANPELRTKMIAEKRRLRAVLYWVALLLTGIELFSMFRWNVSGTGICLIQWFSVFYVDSQVRLLTVVDSVCGNQLARDSRLTSR